MVKIMVAKTTPRAITSLFICNNPKKIKIFKIAPKVINCPKCPADFNDSNPSKKENLVKILINKKLPIKQEMIPIMQPKIKSFIKIFFSIV